MCHDVQYDQRDRTVADVYLHMLTNAPAGVDVSHIMRALKELASKL